jgi:hypothetical protein
MSDRTAKATEKLLQSILANLDYRGIWIASVGRRHRAVKTMFSAQRLAEDEHSKETNILCHTMPNTGDKDTAFEIFLHPPEIYSADDVLASLRASKRVDNTQPVEPEPEPIAPTECPDMVANLHTHKQYWGTVVGFLESPSTGDVRGVFVELYNNVQGMVHISNWANRHISDLRRETQIGKRVRVKIIDNERDDNKIALSKALCDDLDPKEAVNAEETLGEFTGATDAYGVLRTKGYCDDPVRVQRLLDAVAEEMADRSEDKLVVRDITALWKKELCDRYDAVSVTAVGGFFKSLIDQGYLSATDVNGVKHYRITDRGWQQCGGRMVADTSSPPPMPEHIAAAAAAMRDNEPEPEPKPKSMLAELQRRFDTKAKPTVSDDNGHSKTNDLGDLVELAKRLKKYQQVMLRMAEITNALSDYTDLIKERDELQEWLDANPNIEAEVSAGKDVLKILGDVYNG